jgi:hypothetical protein
VGEWLTFWLPDYCSRMLEEFIRDWFVGVCAELNVYPRPDLDKFQDRAGRFRMAEIFKMYDSRLVSRAEFEKQQLRVGRTTVDVDRDLQQKRELAEAANKAIFKHLNSMKASEISE